MVSSINLWYYGILFILILCFIATLILNSTSLLFSSSSSSSSLTSSSFSSISEIKIKTGKVKLTSLKEAFFCSSDLASLSFACQQTHNKNEPIRIAFVGDSIIYGNGTHAGDVAGGKLFQIGSWVNEVIANLRDRADTFCINSPLAMSSNNVNNKNESLLLSTSSSSSSEKKSSPFASNFIPPDARNFGIGKVSLTCKFNQIQNTRIFKKAVMFKPHVLVLGVGLNDCVPYCKEFTKVKFVQEMKQIIQQNFSSAQFVFLVGPPPMETTGFTMAFGFRPWIVQNTIVPLFRQVSNELNLPLLDVFTEWSVEFKKGTAFANNYTKSILIEMDMLIGDGIHPSLKGHRDIATRFEKMVCG